MRDMISNTSKGRSPNQTLSGTTPNGSQAIDRRGYDALTAYLETGTVTVAGTAGFTMKLQHSDTLVGSDFADVPTAQLIPNSAGGTTITVTADADDTILANGIGYNGIKRYVRALITGTTNTNAVVHVLWDLGRPHRAPVPTVVATLATT